LHRRKTDTVSTRRISTEYLLSFIPLPEPYLPVLITSTYTEPLFPNPTTGGIAHYCVRSLSIHSERDLFMHCITACCIIFNIDGLHWAGYLHRVLSTLHCCALHTYRVFLAYLSRSVHPTSSHFFFPSTTTTIKNSSQTNKQTKKLPHSANPPD
jgi:hypothetical protein